MKRKFSNTNSNSLNNSFNSPQRVQRVSSNINENNNKSTINYGNNFVITPKNYKQGDSILYNETFLNPNDFGDLLKKQTLRDNHPDLSMSLERPLNINDIQKFLGNDIASDSDGYLDDIDDDSNYYLNTSENEKMMKRNKLFYENNFQEDNPILPKIKNTNLDDTFDINISEISKIIITNEELKEVLNKNTNGKIKYRLNYIVKEIVKNKNDINNVNNDSNNEEIISILQSDQLILILQYLYSSLHSGLIQLSDNFIAERRKYFTNDHETYISIVEYFLRKKEEFFLCVLSDVMSKLNITQKVLDGTFSYYMNQADGNEENVKNIRDAYDRVYHAGIKYSIAPKNLNKEKLKTILNYQCEIYIQILQENPNYEPDVVEILVTDYVYLEYGYDREAIRAAIKKVNIEEDEEFAEILNRIESIQNNNSFLNI